MRSPRLPALALVTLSLPLAAQTTYYVDASAAPPGNGTQAEPWPQIQTALDNPGLLEGDTILVAPGLYVESLTMDVDRISLKSTHGPEQTELRSPSGATVFRYASPTQFGQLYGPSYLEGFTITGAKGPTPAQGIGAYCRTAGLTIRACVFHGNDVGVFIWWDAVIERCTISNNGWGTNVNAGAVTWVQDSIIWGNEDKDLMLVANYTQFLSVVNSLFPWSTSGVWGGGSQVIQGNVHRDPYFWNHNKDDFHLAPRSKAIGGATNGADMGALPFDDTYAPATPRAYCRAKTDSVGCTPAIQSTGVISTTLPFTISCSEVRNNQLGFLYYGHRSQHTPYKGGWQCVNGPTQRTPFMSSGGSSAGSDCSGSFAVDFDAVIASGNDPNLVVGAPVFAQFWYRDPEDPKGFGDGRSDGLGFTILP